MTDIPSPEHTLPHRRGMLLIEEIVSLDDAGLRARVHVRDGEFLCDETGAPGWIGLEWLAQAGGAWVGVQHRAAGRMVDIGFLTGTRRYQGPDRFPCGAYEVVAEVVIFDRASGFAAFDGRIQTEGGAALGSAQVRLFQPPDTRAFLLQGREEIAGE